MKYTKIVCTIGPSSEKTETLKKMVENGMNIARLNFSHGTHSNHAKLMKNIRSVSKELGTPVSILQDLQGPKIRLGELKKTLSLKAGDKVVFGKDGIPVQFDISKIVKAGDSILIDDGLVEVKAVKVSQGKVEGEVSVGGALISHKGINLPNSKTDFSVFTEKDQKDLLFGLKSKVDFVAMSFIRSASDVLEVKRFIKKHAKGSDQPWVIAKIEKPQAIKNLAEIVSASDAVMVARGDLGIEASEAEVPVYQKMIIKEALAQNKPVIVATQMLDSMIRNPRPTRAEVSDVSNAVFEHADATMLSGESAFGKYPIEAVTVMQKAIVAAEESYFDNVPLRKNKKLDENIRQVILIAKKYELPVILEDNTNGEVSRMFSNARQEVPLVAFFEDDAMVRRMNLFWGIMPMPTKAKRKSEENVQSLIKKGILRPGQNAIYMEAKLEKNKEIIVTARAISA